ncbi:hypothetical protein, partial [Streptococcus pneumoniae]|uniref:hypothetical protein n=1 Tax=Streptococcus pneumoniae TaxID=1313 RepID=UPI001E647221
MTWKSYHKKEKSLGQNSSRPQKSGSIIFVVGKSPMDIMEPILCRKKSHMTYNEKRQNNSLER